MNLTEEQLNKINIPQIDFIIYDFKKYNSPLDAIVNNDFIKNQITVDSEDCYHVFDYSAGLEDFLRQAMPNKTFCWSYFGLDTYKLLNSPILRKDTEREKTPSGLLYDILSLILKELNCTLDTPEFSYQRNQLQSKDLPNRMKHELLGNVSIKNISIRKWLDIIEEKDESVSLMSYVLSQKIKEF